ncbi:MAG TPA: glycosyltransferase [Albitalea sp.]|uniref:glycosyltransferase family 2 protein n=1 Tax=Piscinibacter sp. TaxID=1903157 RepID=UPI002ED69ED3
MSARLPVLVSLVVLSFKRFASTTGPCLASLEGARLDPRLQLILVDNASDDGSAERCGEWAALRSDALYLPQASNLGFGGGMNAGAAAASGEWICLVNSDTVFPAGALPALASTLASLPPSVALVGPVTNQAGNGQRLPLPELEMAKVPAVGATAMRAPTGLLTPSYRTDFFCVAVRRSVWEQLGGLDRAFGLGYYEDFDFSLRLRAAGFEQVIAEDVFVAHVGSASFAKMGDSQHELMRRNRGLLEQRHPAVRFEHVREGNAQALRYLVGVAQASGWTEARRERAAWRYAALLWDEPRSPLKRWRWRFAQRGLRRALAQAGIEPRFPATGDKETT